MTRNYYFPTIDGFPGRFTGDEILCCDDDWPVIPADNIAIIKSQIRKTVSWRKKQGFILKHDYNYQRIEMEVEE